MAAYKRTHVSFNPFWPNGIGLESCNLPHATLQLPHWLRWLLLLLFIWRGNAVVWYGFVLCLTCVSRPSNDRAVDPPVNRATMRAAVLRSEAEKSTEMLF